MSVTLCRWRVVATVLAFALTAAVGTTLAPPTRAAFTTSTANPGNQVEAALLAPTSGFHATCVSSSQVDLSWTPSPTSGVTGYRIERRRDNESQFSHLATVTPRSAAAYSDTASPFPSSLLTLLGTVEVTYRIQAVIDGTDWRSPLEQAATSGEVTSVLGIAVFSCNN